MLRIYQLSIWLLILEGNVGGTDSAADRIQV